MKEYTREEREEIFKLAQDLVIFSFSTEETEEALDKIINWFEIKYANNR